MFCAAGIAWQLSLYYNIYYKLSRIPVPRHADAALYGRWGMKIMDLMLLRTNASRAAALLKSLANEDRLLLLCQLVDGEKTVSELEGLTGIRQPTLSQQLGVLRNEGLVSTRREGKWIYYTIASAEAMTMLAALHGVFCADGTTPPQQ